MIERLSQYLSLKVISSNRSLGLDILRSIAIYFVLIEHARLNIFPSIKLGSLGVELFFVLSGFLVGNILLRSFEKFTGIKSIRKFWINRWFRTLPLYYLALVIQIIIANDINWNYLYYFFFLQNNFFGIQLFSVSWSLVIEEWFYLTLPFIFYLIYLIKRKITFSGILAAFISLILFKLYYISNFESNFSSVNGNIVLRVDTMLVGVALAWVRRYAQSWFHKLSSVYYFLIGFLSIIAIQIMLFVVFDSSLINNNSFVLGLYFPIQSICVALIIPFLYKNEFAILQKKYLEFIKGFITWTSILSYTFFLFHINIDQLVDYYFETAGFLLQLIFLYSLSFIIYMIYEKPFTNLRERFK